MSNAETIVPVSFWERIGTWAAISLLTLSVFYIKKLEDRIDKNETAIIALSVDKVSRPEMKELEYRLRSDIGSIKSEIIERMDWHFNHRQSDKK